MSDKRPQGYADLHKLDEDSRIALIISTLRKMDPGKSIAVCVDKEQAHGKLDRYISKLRQAYPSIIIERFENGPTPGSSLIKVSRPDVSVN